MAADPAILKRIRGCPFARGGRVLVRFRANGYSLFARRSGEPLVRLRLTGNGTRSCCSIPRTAVAGSARRFRRRRHAARPSPPEPQRQSIFPGTSPDLRVSRISDRCPSGTPFPVNYSQANNGTVAPSGITALDAFPPLTYQAAAGRSCSLTVFANSKVAIAQGFAVHHSTSELMESPIRPTFMDQRAGATFFGVAKLAALPYGTRVGCNCIRKHRPAEQPPTVLQQGVASTGRSKVPVRSHDAGSTTVHLRPSRLRRSVKGGAQDVGAAGAAN